MKTGKLVFTLGIDEIAEDGAAFERIMEFFHEHKAENWGNMPEEDKIANDEALLQGTRVMSSWDLDGKEIWIITEGNREITTVLLPEEY